MSFSINLSGQSLGNAALADWLEALCQHHKLPTARICLEITETAAISNLGTAEKLISRLRRMGFRIMLDDFGSGLSSFNYLSNLTVDFIKIDGQFIRQAPDDPLAKSMIRMTVEIARVLGIHCIAEMVENEHAMTLARELGVDYAQGYHIERPTVMPQQSGVYPLRLAGD
jgi:Amt family ammonium transporter